MSLSNFPGLLDRLAQGAVAPGDFDALERLAEAGPGHAAAHVALAQACELEGDRDRAHQRWKHARLLLPDSPAVRAGLQRTAPRHRAAPRQDAAQALLRGSSLKEDADLDSLIEELEGARIEPTPDPDGVPAPELDRDDEEMVSPTLARIYEAQGQLVEAARVHRRLAEERPAEADDHRRQAEALEARAEEDANDEESETEEKDG